jgi:hypothetical protein
VLVSSAASKPGSCTRQGAVWWQGMCSSSSSRRWCWWCLGALFEGECVLGQLRQSDEFHSETLVLVMCLAVREMLGCVAVSSLSSTCQYSVLYLLPSLPCCSTDCVFLSLPCRARLSTQGRLQVHRPAVSMFLLQLHALLFCVCVCPTGPAINAGPPAPSSLLSESLNCPF